MGESRQRSRKRSEVLSAEPRCIYCRSPADTIEHMPPVTMFRDRLRLSGLEFASCARCNNGTKAADAVAALISFISRPGMDQQWHNTHVARLLSAVDQLAPGFRQELVGGRDGANQRWVYTRRGLLEREFQAYGDGPILKRHLDVFSAKLGMALYREHVGLALALDGKVYSRWFLNGGLDNDGANALVSILPMGAALKQGKKISTDQFAYRFNCDEKSIFAALVGFHKNLHIMTIATSDTSTYDPLLSSMRDVGGFAGQWFDIVAPGELSERLCVD